MLVKQRPPPLHVIVFDPGEILEDGATLHVALDASERAVQPGGIHLIGVVVVPGGFNRHGSMLSRRPRTCDEALEFGVIAATHWHTHAAYSEEPDAVNH